MGVYIRFPPQTFFPDKPLIGVSPGGGIIALVVVTYFEVGKYVVSKGF